MITTTLSFDLKDVCLADKSKYQPKKASVELFVKQEEKKALNLNNMNKYWTFPMIVKNLNLEKFVLVVDSSS